MLINRILSHVRLVHVLVGIAIVLTLFWRFDLSLHRYIDADEYAYFSWGRMLSVGKLPYVDFFFFVPPGFLVFIAPMFWFFGGVDVVYALRVLMFVVFVSISLGVGYLFYLVRRSYAGLVATLILIVLPMPFDKFIEVRPDSLAMLLLMIGLIFQILFMRSHKFRFGFFCGGAYALSMLVLPKGIGQVVLGALIYLFQPQVVGLVKRKNMRGFLTHVRPLLIGFGVPILLFGGWALLSGKLGYIFYSLVVMPKEIMNLGKLFYMGPALFFYPNTIFYGADGYGVGLLSTYVLWGVGLLWGMYRLLVPTAIGKTSRASEEILIAGSLFIHTFFYVQVFSLRHTQYLIPQAIFISFYVADFLYAGYSRLHAQGLMPLKIFGVAVVSMLAVWLYQDVQGPKAMNTNQAALAEMKTLWGIIPAGTEVLDLDGRLIYNPHAHPVCCMPFGQFAPFLSQRPASIAQTLEARKTPYVYQGDLERIGTLEWADQDYIYNHYTLVYGKTLWKRK